MLETITPIHFPTYRARKVNMMPFIVGDQDSLPSVWGTDYDVVIETCCKDTTVITVFVDDVVGTN
jgi:hypothetical protein